MGSPGRACRCRWVFLSGFSVSKGRAGPAVPEPLPAHGWVERGACPATSCLSRGKGRLGVGEQGVSSGLRDKTGLSSGGQRGGGNQGPTQETTEGQVAKRGPAGPEAQLGTVVLVRPGWGWGASGGSPSWLAARRAGGCGGAQVGLQPPLASRKCQACPAPGVPGGP